MTELDLFNAAIKLAVDQREAFLAAACGQNGALQKQVEELLRAHDESGGLVPRQTTRDLEITQAQNSRSEPGTLIDNRYKLIEPIGEGGMGTVWLAEQKEPVRRKVAIKLVKAGMDSKQVLDRFEAERQALAMMDHPNIAKVFDGGMTEHGRPYFVMEFVKGVPLTEYCDQARLALKERLSLFIPVCQAVQHAHQKGIIHRDLKPSNILICLYDGKPVPKVIDFGLAKAMHQSLTENTIHTALGVMVGTPLYMSPEQAEHNNLDVDTRTDIYSLGVVLYELLTGSTPLERKQLKEAAYNEILRLIKEVEPPKPSTRLSGSASLPSIAAQRSIDAKQLSKSLAGDLDWIVMKSLDKERGRRYETANGFARDIERFLNDEAVEATPPTAGYRLRKLLRKHRAAVNTAAIIASLVLVGASISAWQAVRATFAERRASIALVNESEQRALAQQNEREALKQKQQAEANMTLANERLAQVEKEKQRAEQEKKIAQSVRDFLQNKLLRQAALRQQLRSLVGGGRDLRELKYNPTILELLDRAASELTEARIEENFPGQPLLQVELLETVGKTYLGIFEAETCIKFLERAVKLRKQFLGAESPETLSAMADMAIVLHENGQSASGLELLEKVYDELSRELGPEDRKTLRCHQMLLSRRLPKSPDDQKNRIHEIEELHKTHIRLFGPADPDSISSRFLLAQVSRNHDLAVEILEQELKTALASVAPNQLDIIDIKQNLAGKYWLVGRHAESFALQKEVLLVWHQVAGPDDPRTLTAEMNFAQAVFSNDSPTKELQEATKSLEGVVEKLKTKLSDSNETTLNAMNSLANAYIRIGKPSEAVVIAKKASDKVLEFLSSSHEYAWAFLDTLAEAYEANGQIEEMDKVLMQIDELTFKVYGPTHPVRLFNKYSQAVKYIHTGRIAAGVAILEKLKTFCEKNPQANAPKMRQVLGDLGKAYRKSGQFEKALEIFKQISEEQKTQYGDTDPKTIIGLAAGLLETYSAAGMFEEAEELGNDLLQRARESFPPSSPELARVMGIYGGSLLEAKHYQEAELILRDSLAIYERFDTDHWTTFNIRSMLGSTLLGEEKFAEAEPLLISGYEGLLQIKGAIPAEFKDRLPRAARRIVSLYSAWHEAESTTGYDTKADEWKVKIKQTIPTP